MIETLKGSAFVFAILGLAMWAADCTHAAAVVFGLALGFAIAAGVIIAERKTRND